MVEVLMTSEEIQVDLPDGVSSAKIIVEIK